MGAAAAPKTAPARAPRRRKRPASSGPGSPRKAAASTAGRAAVAAGRAAAAPATAPARTAPPRRSPARKAPARRRAPSRRPGGNLIPIAVGTAQAVRGLPDSGLVVQMTRGRAWIAVLGVLLAGIVALNVVTLSLAAQAGQVEQDIQTLEERNSILRSRDAQLSGAGKVRGDAEALGLSPAALDDVSAIQAGPGDAREAARRLAAAAGY